MEKLYKILWAEDEARLREVMTELLVSEGFYCEQVSNGIEAKSCLENGNFDLLITDFNMPLMNGSELIKWCRKNGYHLPIIFVTGNPVRNSEEKVVLGDCCTAIILKPLSFDVLLDEIEKAKGRTHDFHCNRTNSLKSSEVDSDHFEGEHFRAEF